jgi:hypothetical protein
MPKAANQPPQVNWDELEDSETHVYVDESRPVPDAVINLVEDSYEFWFEHQNRWSEKTLKSAKLAAATITEARRYCTSVRAEPLTFQVKNYKEGDTKLVYRAREAIRRERGEESGNE